MKIREFRESDKIDIDKLHNTYFKDNEYPDFDKLKSPFVVTNDEDRVILACGIKLLGEVIVVSDKDLPVKTRLDALLQVLGSSIFICSALGQKELYAFVNNDEGYIKVLQKYGFKLIDAKLLVLDFGDFHG